MSSGNVTTGSEALIEFQKDLTLLSEELHGIFDLMYDNMIKIQEFWQDAKYDEFVASYRPQIEKCEEISKRYDDWCQKVLRPTIDSVIEVEHADVSANGGVNSPTDAPPDTPQTQNHNPIDNSTNHNQNTQPQQPNNSPTMSLEENTVIGDNSGKSIANMSMDEVLSQLTEDQKGEYYRKKKEIENSKITAFYSEDQRQKDLLELDEKTKDILRDERAKNYKQIWENPSSDPVNYAGYRAFGKNGVRITDCEIVESADKKQPWNVKYGKGVSTEHSQEISYNVSGGAELGGAKLMGSYNESQAVGMIKKQSAKTTGFCKTIDNPEDFKFLSVDDLNTQQVLDELSGKKKETAIAWKNEIEQRKEERFRNLYHPHRKFPPNESEIEMMNKLNERDDQEWETAIRRGVRTQRSDGIFPKPDGFSAADLKAKEQVKAELSKSTISDIKPGKYNSYSTELSDEEMKWYQRKHQEQTSGGLKVVYSIGASKTDSHTQKELNGFEVDARFNIKDINETSNVSME